MLASTRAAQCSSSSGSGRCQASCSGRAAPPPLPRLAPLLRHQRQRAGRAAAAAASSSQQQQLSDAAAAAEADKAYTTVSDAMSSGTLFCCLPDDAVDSALEKLVQHRVTGLPVVSDFDSLTVVGVVSDYDLLALDKLGAVKDDRQLFPQADETWQAFKEVKRLLAKSSGRRVRDVMTATPIVVNPETDLDEAATLLLSKKIHRLPVVDASGRLVGVLSRGNLVKAALAVRKASAAAAPKPPQN